MLLVKGDIISRLEEGAVVEVGGLRVRQHGRTELLDVHGAGLHARAFPRRLRLE
jgi:hypothetical protein